MAWNSMAVSTCAPNGTAIKRPPIRQKPISPAAMSQSCQKSRNTSRASTNPMSRNDKLHNSTAEPSGWPLTRSSIRPSGAAAQGRNA